jgi:hypothetical protein
MPVAFNIAIKDFPSDACTFKQTYDTIPLEPESDPPRERTLVLIRNGKVREVAAAMACLITLGEIKMLKLVQFTPQQVNEFITDKEETELMKNLVAYQHYGVVLEGDGIIEEASNAAEFIDYFTEWEMSFSAEGSAKRDIKYVNAMPVAKIEGKLITLKTE